MAIKKAKGQIILLSDFNAHYLIWSGKYIANKEQAEYLLAKTGAKSLILIILKGEPIWKREQQKSIINFIFISLDLYRKVNFYSIVRNRPL